VNRFRLSNWFALLSVVDCRISSAGGVVEMPASTEGGNVGVPVARSPLVVNALSTLKSAKTGVVLEGHGVVVVVGGVVV